MPAKSLLLLFVEKADLLIFVNFLFLRKNGNSTTVGDVATLIFTVPNSTNNIFLQKLENLEQGFPGFSSQCDCHKSDLRRVERQKT